MNKRNFLSHYNILREEQTSKNDNKVIQKETYVKINSWKDLKVMGKKNPRVLGLMII